MKIQADVEGRKAITALCDAALKHDGVNAFNVVAFVQNELNKTSSSDITPPEVEEVDKKNPNRKRTKGKKSEGDIC